MATGEGICPAIKPLLDTVVSEASHILNLSEVFGSGHPNQDMHQSHIQPPGSSVHAFHGSSNFRKATSAQQPYHVSPHNTYLLSEIEALKRELCDVQQSQQIIVNELNHAAKCGNNDLELTPQQDQSRGQDKMQLFEQKLHIPNGKALYLNQYLVGTGEQILKDNKTVSSAAVDLKPAKTKIHFKKALDKMQMLNHTVETSELKEEADIAMLRMQLRLSEKEIICLQSELRISDMKSKSLEEQLFGADQKVQSMQDRLITTNDKAINLEEALRASGEMMQSLRKSLQEREIEASTAKDQLQILQEHNLEHQKTIEKMSSSLGASEKLYQKRLPELETGLKNYKRQVEYLQDKLRGAEFTHKEEMEELTNEIEKQTMHLQYLQGQVLDLSKKLLKEQQQARKVLGGSVKYEECVQNHMQEARHGDMTQNDHQSYAMDNLSRRGQAGTTNENLLQHGIQRTRPAYGLGEGERPLQAGLNSLREGFVELRESLNEVFKHSGETEDQKRLDWMKVLERSQEWEKRAEKLIDSMFYVQNHHMLESKRSFNDGTNVKGRPLSYTYSPESVSHKKNNGTQTWPWNSHMPDLEQCKQYQFHSPNEARHSDSMTHLLRLQKHIKDAQTVGFDMNTQGSLRMS